MKKQNKSLYVIIAMIAFINSNSYTADDSECLLIRDSFNTMKDIYGGFLGSILTHRQKAAACGLISLYIAPKIGSYVGGALGIGTGAVLSSVTNRDPATGILLIGSGGVLGSALGYIAGIPTSYMLYKFLSNRWIRNADERIDSYTKRHLTPANHTSLLKYINAPGGSFSVQNFVFQGNETSYDKFKYILDGSALIAQ